MKTLSRTETKKKYKVVTPSSSRFHFTFLSIKHIHLIITYLDIEALQTLLQVKMIFTTATTVLALAATFISGGQAAAVKPAGETNLEARQANCNLTVGDSYCGWYLINNLRCTYPAHLTSSS